MEIGAGFDDSLFEASDKSQLIKKKGEAGKNCKFREPLWFTEVEAIDEETEEDQDQMQVYKSQGDWLYYNKDFTGAARKYQDALGILPKGNATVRRDLLECISCCHIAEGQERQAMIFAHMLKDEGTNFEQQTVLLNLFKRIHHQFGNRTGELVVLEKLLTLHPYNHHLWLELAEVFRIIHSNIRSSDIGYSDEDHVTGGGRVYYCIYGNSYGSNGAIHKIENCNNTSDIDLGVMTEALDIDASPQPERKCIYCPLCLGIIARKHSSTSDKERKQVNSEESNSLDCGDFIPACNGAYVESECHYDYIQAQSLLPDVKIDLLIAVCLIRARLLLQSVYSSVATFGKEKHEVLQLEICEKLKSLNVSQEQMDNSVKFLSQDIYRKEKDEIKPQEDNKPASVLILDKDPKLCVSDFNITWFSWLQQD